MEHNTSKRKHATQILLCAGALVLLAATGSAGMGVGGPAAPAHDDADTACGNVGTLLPLGYEKQGAMDPATDTEDAVGLQVGPAWEERGVELTIEAGRESAVGTYVLGIEVYPNTDCTGTPMETASVAYGDTIVVPFTISGSSAHGVRVDIDDAGAQAPQLGDKEGHCYPVCIIDWSVRFTLPGA